MLGSAAFREMQVRDAVREAEACLVRGHAKERRIRERPNRISGIFFLTFLNTGGDCATTYIRHGCYWSSGGDARDITGSYDGGLAYLSGLVAHIPHARFVFGNATGLIPESLFLSSPSVRLLEHSAA